MDGEQLHNADDLPIDADLAPFDPAQPAPDHRSASPEERRSRRARADVLAAIAAGGAIGAPARYGVAQLIHVAKDGFPWATLWTNLSGSFALGLLLVLIIERFPPSRYLRPFFATGFLGAYTTFSTFAVETDLLVKDGHSLTAAAYVVASLGGGLAAVSAGMWLGRRTHPLRTDAHRTPPNAI